MAARSRPPTADERDAPKGQQGERGAGVHAASDDGLHFDLAADVKAYSRRIQWDDGSFTDQAHVERPNLLIENGRPVCFYAATGLGEYGFTFHRTTWNVAIPIAHS